MLGPLMFLMYINDIRSGISSNLRLFADDGILYQVVRCDQDHNSLQYDLDLLVKWTQLWQMSLNISKCVTLTCSRRPPLFSSSYLTTIETSYWTSILGSSNWFQNVFLSSYFIRWNLCKCNKEVTAWLILVWFDHHYNNSTPSPALPDA